MYVPLEEAPPCEGYIYALEGALLAKGCMFSKPLEEAPHASGSVMYTPSKGPLLRGLRVCMPLEEAPLARGYVYALERVPLAKDITYNTPFEKAPLSRYARLSTRRLLRGMLRVCMPFEEAPLARDRLLCIVL